MLVTGVAAHAAMLGFVEDFNGGTVDPWRGGSEAYAAMASGGAGGAADGFLEVANRVPERNLGVHTDDANFTGDLIGDGVTGFAFWLRDVGEADDLEIHVGVGSAFSNVWLSTDGFVPAQDRWTRFMIDITDDSKWVQTIGSGTFEQALSASNRLLFRHDVPPLVQQPQPIRADVGIDRITILPEPVLGPALLLGCLLIRGGRGRTKHAGPLAATRVQPKSIR